jgi:hypothetical protein
VVRHLGDIAPVGGYIELVDGLAILGLDGRLILRQTGPAISDLAYEGGAWLSWRTQAATLRAVLSG